MKRPALRARCRCGTVAETEGFTMPIYFTGENAEEAKALAAEMNEILAKMTSMDVFADVKGYLALEARHHEIAVRLQQLDQSGDKRN